MLPPSVTPSRVEAYCKCEIICTYFLQDIPQQMNGSDCGVFSCKYAEYLSRNASFTFSQVCVSNSTNSSLECMRFISNVIISWFDPSSIGYDIVLAEKIFESRPDADSYVLT